MNGQDRRLYFSNDYKIGAGKEGFVQSEYCMGVGYNITKDLTAYVPLSIDMSRQVSAEWRNGSVDCLLGLGVRYGLFSVQQSFSVGPDNAGYSQSSAMLRYGNSHMYCMLGGTYQYYFADGTQRLFPTIGWGFSL